MPDPVAFVARSAERFRERVLRRQVKPGSGTTDPALDQLHDQQEQIDRLSLVLRTVLAMAEARGVFTDAEFIRAMELVDLEDGVKDGKRRKRHKKRVCANCSSANPRFALKCLWCGADFGMGEPV